MFKRHDPLGMTLTYHTLAHLIQGKEKYLLYPAAIVASLAGLLIMILGLSGAVGSVQRTGTLIAGVGTAVYAWALSFAIVYLDRRKPFLRWTIAILNALGMAALSVFLPGDLRPLLFVLWIATITLSCIFIGRWQATLMIGIFTALSAILMQPLKLTWESILAVSLTGIMLNETLYRLGAFIARRVQRLEAINHMSRTIASSIEMEKVIALVCASVQEALLADTYFVGLLDGKNIRLELFYDEGEFFPPVEIPIDNTLVGWVIENRKPLLLCDMPRELPKLGVNTRIIGKDRPSLSWIGAPVAVGKRLLGVVAMASYRRNAFDEDDLQLLESMAQQTALVIDNAYRYAEVERLSRLDSLTQVYNHGQFLAYLEEYAEYAATSELPLSLIMLDLDYFKQYNDSYGHLAGDQALTMLVTALRQSVRSRDLLGRWGGEEFAILLPETNGMQAMQVAERIRTNLRALVIKTQNGRSIPMPTVSQGIAVYAEASSGEKLVDLADQRLYLAKARGRDQIEPGTASWEAVNPTMATDRSTN
jgi:diguanylate cyclase (GGDEF)-like protein